MSALQTGFGCATENVVSDELFVFQQLSPLLGLRALPFKLTASPPPTQSVAPERMRLFLSVRDLRVQLFEGLLEGIRSGATRDIRKLAAELLGHNCDAAQLHNLLAEPLDVAANAFRQRHDPLSSSSPPTKLLNQTKGAMYSICTFSTAGIRSVLDDALFKRTTTSNAKGGSGHALCPEQSIFLLFCKTWRLLEAVLDFLSDAAEPAVAECSSHEQMKCACVDSLAALLAVATALALPQENRGETIATDCADAAMDCISFCIFEELAAECSRVTRPRSPALWLNMLERCELATMHNNAPTEEGRSSAAAQKQATASSKTVIGLGSAASNVVATLSRVLGGGSSRNVSKPESGKRAQELREFAAARSVEFLRSPLALLAVPCALQSESKSVEYFHTSCAALLQAAVVAVASAGRLRPVASGPTESVHHTLLRVAEHALQLAASVTSARSQIHSHTRESGGEHRNHGPQHLQPSVNMGHQAIKLAFAVIADAVRQRTLLERPRLKVIFDAVTHPSVKQLCADRADMVHVARSLAQLLESLIALPDM